MRVLAILKALSSRCFALTLGFALLSPCSALAAESLQDHLRVEAQLVPVPGAAAVDFWRMHSAVDLQVSERNLRRMLTHFQPWLARQMPEFQLQDVQIQAGELQLTGTVYRWFFYDRLRLVLDFPRSNRLRLRVRDNWFPTWAILDEVEEALGKAQVFELTRSASELNAQPVSDAVRQGKLELLPLELNAGIQRDRWAFQLQPRNAQAAQLPGVRLNWVTEAQETEHQLAESHAQIALQLEEEHLGGIALGNETLIKRLQAFDGRFDIDAQILHGGAVDGSFRMWVDEFEAEGRRYTDFRSVPFDWTLDFDLEGEPEFNIWPDLPQLPPLTQQEAGFSPNAVDLFVDGPDYFEELQRILPRARKSIEQEIFVFYPGQTTRKLVRLYWLKALGLKEDPEGGFLPDPYAPQGVPVRLLHNHKLTHQGAAIVAELFDSVGQELEAQLRADARWAAQFSDLEKRAQAHLQVLPLSQGVLHSDHRKLLVVDGEVAYTGGLNMGDHYLTADSFHDVMVQVQGPAVQQMRQLFVDNWLELSAQHQPAWKAIAPATPSPQRSALVAKEDLHGAQVAVVTTDYDSYSVARALYALIGSARERIRLEHAYIYDAPTEEALRQALDRGVQLDLVFSKRNDEFLFELINPATVRDLMRMYPDQVRAWLYVDESGSSTYMSHTKYLSVDGEQALVGSANLIPRSLISPFTQGDAGQPILFNEELSLWIQDADFVQEMDRRILDHDIAQHGEAVTAEDLSRLIQERGGAWQLFLERFKGILS